MAAVSDFLIPALISIGISISGLLTANLALLTGNNYKWMQSPYNKYIDFMQLRSLYIYCIININQKCMRLHHNSYRPSPDKEQNKKGMDLI